MRLSNNTLFLLRCNESGFGPERQFAAMQDDAGNGVLSGRSPDEAGTAVPDPFQKAGLSGYDAVF